MLEFRKETAFEEVSMERPCLSCSLRYREVLDGHRKANVYSR